MNFWFTGQGGGLGYDKANTIYPIPYIGITQEEGGFEWGEGHPFTGKTWLITLTWLFWTAGIAFGDSGAGKK